MFKQARALHYVLKIASLKESIRFFRDKLCMTVQRHEVFGEGCKASCNGPYDGKWTKTMIGYGSEDEHFVLELTYNFDVKSYKLGNDLQFIRLALSGELYDKVSANLDGALASVRSPDGYEFRIERSPNSRSDIVEVCLGVASLDESLAYWRDTLQMQMLAEANGEKYARLSYEPAKQASLGLKQIDEPLERAEAFGRTAFSVPSASLRPLSEALESRKYKILVPYVSLDTPGKASVEVVIVADPSGHEICFVCDEGFRALSVPDSPVKDLYY